VLRSVTDEIMYEIMLMTGQEYVDDYASRFKEQSAAAETAEATKPAETAEATKPAETAEATTPAEPAEAKGTPPNS
jgi:1-acyl-sn-glycerol-3-phosphate acyltransferase